MDMLIVFGWSPARSTALSVRNILTPCYLPELIRHLLLVHLSFWQPEMLVCLSFLVCFLFFFSPSLAVQVSTGGINCGEGCCANASLLAWRQELLKRGWHVWLEEGCSAEVGAVWHPHITRGVKSTLEQAGCHSDRRGSQDAR